MAKKTDKTPKTRRWAKTPLRGIDLRVPLFVTDEMVADVEGLLLSLAPNASTGRLTDSLSRYPWKDPEAELVLEDIGMATSEEVLDMIFDGPEVEAPAPVEEQLSIQDLRDLAVMNSEDTGLVMHSLDGRIDPALITDEAIDRFSHIPGISVAGPSITEYIDKVARPVVVTPQIAQVVEAYLDDPTILDDSARSALTMETNNSIAGNAIEPNGQVNVDLGNGIERRF